MDSLTVLLCEPGRRLAKLWRPDAARPEDYDAGLVFRTMSVPVASLADLYAALRSLESRPDLCIIRGEPVDDFGDAWVRRLAIATPESPARFGQASRLWLAVDVDETVIPFDLADPTAAVAAWAAGLPGGLRGAGFVWQFTSKSHSSPTLRGRAWFWLDAPAADRPLRAWADANGFDRSLYIPTQPHYTAAPIFDGMADPLAGHRLLFVDGPPAHLDLPVDVGADDEYAREAGPELGTPSPAYDAARSEFLAALGPRQDHTGHVWHMFGAIGGMCRKAGWPAGDCAELVRQWVDGCRASPWKYIHRALGAYSVPAEKCTGHHELASVTGSPELADRAADAAALNISAVIAAAVGSVPVAAPSEPFPSLCRFVDITVPVPPRDYMIEGLRLDKGKISIVGGYAGVSKGPLLNLIGVCRAAGKPLFGALPLRQGHVLFLDAETGEEAVRRVQRMAAGIGVELDALQEYLHFGTLVPSQSPDMWIPDLERAAQMWPDLLVCLDSYTSAMFASGLESVKTEYAGFANRMGLVSRDRGVTFLAAMHARKDTGHGLDLESIAGTNSLAAMTQTAILLRRPKPDDEYTVEVSCARAPAGRFDSFCIRWEGADGQPLTARQLTEEERKAATETRAEARDRLAEAKDRASAVTAILETAATSGALMRPDQFAGVTGWPKNDVAMLVTELIGAGLLERRGEYVAPVRQPSAIGAAFQGIKS